MQSLLKEKASRAVLDLLPEVAGGELGSVCSWADEVRYQKRYRWSYSLHFVNTPGVCDYNYSSMLIASLSPFSGCLDGFKFQLMR